MLITATSTDARAQSALEKIQVRPMGPILASSTEPFGVYVSVRDFTDGSVLVNDVFHKRVLKLNARLEKQAIVIDSARSAKGGSSAVVAMASANLIRYLGDSTLFADVASNSVLVLDRNGKVARTMSMPRSNDVIHLATGIVNGIPTLDPQGRLVYRGVSAAPQKLQSKNDLGNGRMFPVVDRPDSSPIVRADFDSRTVDTLAMLKLRRWTRLSESTDTNGKPTTQMELDPMATGDEWAMLNDGTIAIVRAQDYHIDWVDPQGKRRSTPKMPIDWRRVTDAEKQFKLDSMRALFERPSLSTAASNTAARRLKIAYRPIDSLADYEPPIAPGAVRADNVGNLWVLPRTSSSAKGGLLYDVINRQGKIIYRVQLPKGYSLAGFGDGDLTYMLRVDGSSAFLTRAHAPN